jgi:homospermidine synthase
MLTFHGRMVECCHCHSTGLKTIHVIATGTQRRQEAIQDSCISRTWSIVLMSSESKRAREISQ